MEIKAIVDADYAAWSAAEYLRAERAVQRGIGGATQSLKAAWRANVARSLSTRMGNAVRADVYPKGQPSANAAGLVWTKSPQIIDAHERGVTIRSKNGFWLAVPLPAAGRGAGGKRITPGEWEAKTGRVLRFVYRGGRRALLVDDGRVKQGARLMKRDGFSRAARGFRNRTVPVFALVPQVKLKKVLNLMQLAQTIGASLPERIAGTWES